MVKSYPEVMAAEDAVLYLRERLGECGPQAETLRTWSQRSHRERHPETIARLKLPIGVVVEGTKKRAWLRESLDTYADAVVAEVRKGLSEGQAADKGAG